MTEQPDTTEAPTAVSAVASTAGDAPAGGPNPSGYGAGAGDRPELAVGAAFAGGLALALILKRLAR